MPSLGADMTEGTLLEWLVHPGDVVHRGDIIAVVDTSKSAIDVEVFQDGTVTTLLVEPGATVPVGEPLALLEDGEAEPPQAEPPQAEPPQAEPPPSAEPQAPPAAQPVHHDSAHIPASPFARRRAVELGIDLADVAGHGGVISVADVERAAQTRTGQAPPGGAPEHPAPGPHVEPSPEPPSSGPDRASHAAAMREAIAALMARSKREIPHYYLTLDIDMKASLDWLAERNTGRTVAERVLPAAVLLAAVARALPDFPDMNGTFTEGVYHPSDRVNLGVAIALRGGGLIAPGIPDADQLDLDTLMARMKDLVTRARGGRLRSSEMSDSTITVTSLGEQGAQSVHGVIYPPQVALVGYGRIVDRPVAVDGMLAVRPVVTATLAADHRVSDGHRGGLFLARIAELLVEPDSLGTGRADGRRR